jgi:hypothetical protein
MAEIRRRPGTGAGPASAPTDTPHGTAMLRQLKRRRAASRRTVPLDCGCSDPWPCQCTELPLSRAAVDGWRDAARHVIATGQIPVLPLEVRRALWRRGGPDRELAEWLHDSCGGIPA